MRTKMIYKKGNVEEVGNYRPICTLPLYRIVLNNHIQQTLQQTRPSAIRRPGRTWTFLLNAGPSCNIQTAGTEMPGVGYQNVRRDSGLHEGIVLNESPVFMETLEKCGIESHHITSAS